MRAMPTAIPGVSILTLDSPPPQDERGQFMRLFCEREMQAAGIAFHTVQTSLSRNSAQGTLRGMHYQDIAAPEPKLVRCIRGAIYDVALDMRDGSPTFGKWEAVELNAENNRALFIDGGIAHGFLTLQDDAEVLYHMAGFYAPEHGRIVRWNDPRFAIRWPMPPRVISPRDASAPDYA